MIHPLTVTLPITGAAFHRFAVNARAEGISLEVYLARLSTRGLGVPIADLLAQVFGDAADAATIKEKGHEIPIATASK